MIPTLINPNDPLERQNEKLLKIAESLMRRVEESTNASGAAYAQFQRAAMLEQEVRARTQDLERALDLLNDSNGRLALANQETEAARANLANAIETVQEGFALFNTDEELALCNSRFGMHMPDIRKALVPGLQFIDYVDLVSKSHYLSLPESETPLDWATRRMERHQDDHVIFNVRMSGRRWVQVSEHRTLDGGTVILQTDITDIMRVERQERDRILDDQARLIRATLEHIDQGLCIFDSKQRLAGWNTRASELLTIPTTQFQMGAQFSTLFARARAEMTFEGVTGPEAVEAWVNSEDERPPLSFEVNRGRTNYLSVFAQEMPDKGFVISFTDVTAERQAAQALANANEMLEQRVADRTEELAEALLDAERANASKSRFVAAASHDLLQPLSAAKLYVASLGGDDDNETRRVAAKAESALNSVEHILEALLDISKLDSGRASVHVSTVPLGDMFRQLGDAFRPAAHAKGLDLRIVPTKARVASDAAYLRRIVQNLMSNAIRYSEKGKILVGARHVGNSVRIEVWDTGIGIPKDQQEVVFREFQRLNADASAAEGMGLGLAIVERACGLLKHPVRLESEVGKGTMLSIEVPRVDVVSVDTDRTEPQNDVEQNGDLAGVIALLIENDENLRNALTMTMEGWGVNVIDCPGQDHAVDLLREIEVSPDFIIADYQLDDGALGTDAIKAITDEFGPIPSCIISANRSIELIDACAKSNLLLLPKPIDAQRLMQFLGGIVVPDDPKLRV